ncbi:hypothetical protein RJ640_011578 [Escallonia rubra]|uniref:HTH La-type RNA-binding domain-containing protein n=1 Tax=Escallonia rubra TaxID=112253 RepID=A0AA88UNR1_9ASTE|nr:hypothetical protein RJ640_011578 [Escallonia rubra]
MAAASNLAINSPGEAAALNSPKSRSSGAAARGVSSPWTQIVRGGESESIGGGVVAAPSSPSSSGVVDEQIESSSTDWLAAKATAAAGTSFLSDDPPGAEAQSESSDNAAKKPAWNKPSNGAVEVGPVMGAVSWPALSESTRASPKLSSSESLKTLDGSSPASQGAGISLSPHKQVAPSNANQNTSPNHVTQRQKSMKRGGGSSSGSVSANGGFPQPSPPPQPQGSVVEVNPNSSGKPSTAAVESSSKDHTNKEPGQRGGFGSQPQSGNEHQQQRGNFRRGGNGGSHPRGDGGHHQHYGGRRDHERGNQEWSRGFRDTHMQSPRGAPRGFVRPPPHTSTPFISPPPVPMRPFGSPMMYPEVASPLIYLQGPTPEALRGVPFVAPMPPHAMFFPVPDPQLHAKLVTQIDYYFSNENLIKDTFLRQNMDDQGWVPIKLIAGFKKVSFLILMLEVMEIFVEIARSHGALILTRPCIHIVWDPCQDVLLSIRFVMYLTDNIQLILDAVRTSNIVELQGDRVRRRNDWMRWIMPTPLQGSAVSSPQSIGRSSHDMLAAHFQSVAFDEKTSKPGHAEMLFSRSSSGDYDSQSQQSGGERTDQVFLQSGFEHSTLAEISSK